MRKLIIICLELLSVVIVGLAIASCKKQATPQPAMQQQQQNNVVVNTNSLNAQEQLLAFDWKLFKHYGQGTPGGAVLIDQTYNNPTDCHLALSSTTVNSAPYPYMKNAANGMANCSPINTYWYINQLNILSTGGSDFYIQLVTNDTLIITTGTSANAYTQKFKFWK